VKKTLLSAVCLVIVLSFFAACKKINPTTATEAATVVLTTQTTTITQTATITTTPNMTETVAYMFTVIAQAWSPTVTVTVTDTITATATVTDTATATPTATTTPYTITYKVSIVPGEFGGNYSISYTDSYLNTQNDSGTVAGFTTLNWVQTITAYSGQQLTLTADVNWKEIYISSMQILNENTVLKEIQNGDGTSYTLSAIVP
jgi:hypothetical protein